MLQSSSREGGCLPGPGGCLPGLGGCLPGPGGVCLVWGGLPGPGGALPAGGFSLPGGAAQRPPCEQNHTHVLKHNLGHNFVAAGNN